MSSLEAKIVVVGSQGVGKTSLVTRFCKGSFDPSKVTSTVGASFLAKRVVDSDSDTTVRLQIWDTAGQERFRSISRLYYRGANACILCYSITDAHSFAEMGIWLSELRRNLPADIVLHVVGTKADLVARDPALRQVPFERCIAYVAENLAPGATSTPPPALAGSFGASALFSGATLGGVGGPSTTADGDSQRAGPDTHTSAGLRSLPIGATATAQPAGLTSPPLPGYEPRSPSSKRSSGFWGQEAGWDACHEISAESGEGVEEVFRVVTRKLVEQNRKIQQALLAATSTMGPPLSGAGAGGQATAGHGGYASRDGHRSGAGVNGNSGASGDGYGHGYGGVGGYADAAHGRGSFRVGRDRRSWLFASGFGPEIAVDPAAAAHGGDNNDTALVRQRRCC